MELVNYAKILLRGVGQVMFMQNALSGLFFLIGIIFGGTPMVVLSGCVALVCATVSGKCLYKDTSGYEQGLGGFNGILVGCAIATFFVPTLSMCVVLATMSIISPCMSYWGNKMLGKLGLNSLTFPFVLLTLSTFFLPFLSVETNDAAVSSVAVVPNAMFFIKSCLNGISQVFLVCSPVCGMLFLAGLFVGNKHAAIWSVVGSVIGMVLALAYGLDLREIENGIYGFNTVLTAIALGAVFRKKMVVSFLGIITTFFVQVALVNLCSSIGIPVLTAPFCITTWLFQIIFKEKEK